MFSRLRQYLGLYKEIKDTPEIPEVTQFLEQSKTFEKLSISIHNIKLKAWQKLDEAAFPEEYENKKYIENQQQGQQQNQYKPQGQNSQNIKNK